jgi:hypothetical protein
MLIFVLMSISNSLSRYFQNLKLKLNFSRIWSCLSNLNLTKLCLQENIFAKLKDPAPIRSVKNFSIAEDYSSDAHDEFKVQPNITSPNLTQPNLT